MDDELTADLETLEQLERETRDHPARSLFESALKAQIEWTRRNGRGSLVWEQAETYRPYQPVADADIPW